MTTGIALLRKVDRDFLGCCRNFVEGTVTDFVPPSSDVKLFLGDCGCFQSRRKATDDVFLPLAKEGLSASMRKDKKEPESLSSSQSCCCVCDDDVCGCCSKALTRRLALAADNEGAVMGVAVVSASWCLQFEIGSVFGVLLDDFSVLWY